MKLLKWASRSWAVVLLSTLVAACGGGGGGGSEGGVGDGGGGSGGASAPTVTVIDALAISLEAGTEIKAETFAKTVQSQSHSITLWLRLDGDANAINGRVLYVVTEMPDAGLYAAQPQVALGGGYVYVTLIGDPAGLVQGGPLHGHHEHLRMPRSRVQVPAGPFSGGRSL
jgi:hypothetical protein